LEKEKELTFGRVHTNTVKGEWRQKTLGQTGGGEKPFHKLENKLYTHKKKNFVSTYHAHTHTHSSK